MAAIHIACARKIDMMKDDRAARDHGGHSGHSAEEKIKRNFPRPDRWFDHGLTVVSWFTRDRATGNVHAFAGNDAFLPRLFAQFFKTLFAIHRSKLGSASASLAPLCAARNFLSDRTSPIAFRRGAKTVREAPVLPISCLSRCGS